jgi:hypothetical protein
MNDLTKVTVNLTPKSYEALHKAAQLEEMSRTDTINKAIQFYEFITRISQTHTLYLQDKSGQFYTLNFHFQ